MTTYPDQLYGEALDWLLQEDGENLGVRYFALRDLCNQPADSAELLEARRHLMRRGHVPAILAHQEPEGYWVKPGPGYGPKYRSTVWSMAFLAQLGADGTDPRIRRGGEYILQHSIASDGAFSVSGTPSGAIYCLCGNLSKSLIDLGWWGDERLIKAVTWLARAITGEGMASADEENAPLRYHRSGTSGPRFECSANNRQPCAWGAVKATLALTGVPPEDRTPLIQSAIEVCRDFLLSCDPAVADYPMGWNTKPSQSWFRFGFPLFYVTDVLQNLEALIALGEGGNPRLAKAQKLVLGQRDKQGHWKMAYTYNGKTWTDVEMPRQPSKWVTLRALRVLRSLPPTEL